MIGNMNFHVSLPWAIVSLVLSCFASVYFVPSYEVYQLLSLVNFLVRLHSVGLKMALRRYLLTPIVQIR